MLDVDQFFGPRHKTRVPPGGTKLISPQRKLWVALFYLAEPLGGDTLCNSCLDPSSERGARIVLAGRGSGLIMTSPPNATV